MFSRTLTATEIVENTISINNRMSRMEHFKIEYPDYIPVFIKYYDSDSIFKNILHKDIPYVKLLFIIRRRRRIKSGTALMSLVEKERDEQTGNIECAQVPTNMTIGEIAEKYLHKDGFMYINICTENVFG